MMISEQRGWRRAAAMGTGAPALIAWLGSAAGSLGASAPALAQAADDPVHIDEVVVTARKRTESLKDVPVAATVVTADTLERFNMRSVTDMASITPGLNINSDSIARAFVAIRGVGTTFQATVQPGVGVFIDGIYQPNTSYLNNPALDIERIEVLRGPQGTVYGKNTLGGAINVVTRQPGEELEGRITTGYTHGDEATFVSAAVGGPIVSGVLQGRLSVSTERSDGFWKNRLIGGDAFPVETESVTGSVRWELSDATVVNASGYHLSFLGGDVAYSDLRGERDYRDNIVLNVLNRADFTYRGGNIKLTAQMPGNTQLSAIGAYDVRDSRGNTDGDFTTFDIVRSSGDGELETRTAELRFDTEFSDRFSTLLGLFISDATADSAVVQRIPSIGASSTTVSTKDEQAHAIFATAFWKLPRDFEFTAGLRYDHSEVEAGGYTFATATPGNRTPIPPARISANEIEPRVSLTRFWSPQWMSYVSAARGYRGGGINSANAPAHLRTYKGDSVWTYELGAKLESADRRVSLASAIFYNDYKDLIGNNSLAQNPAGGLVTVDLNTGDVESYGFEAELAARLTPRWTVNGAVTLLHARITDDSPYVLATGRTLPSDRLLFQPDWNYSVESIYRVPAGAGHLSLRAAVLGKGERDASSFDQVNPTVLESYHLLDASIGYEIGRFSLSVFGSNLLGEQYFESYIDDSALGSLGLPPTNLGILGADTRVGIRVKYEL